MSIENENIRKIWQTCDDLAAYEKENGDNEFIWGISQRLSGLAILLNENFMQVENQKVKLNFEIFELESKLDSMQDKINDLENEINGSPIGIDDKPNLPYEFYSVLFAKLDLHRIKGNLSMNEYERIKEIFTDSEFQYNLEDGFNE